MKKPIISLTLLFIQIVVAGQNVDFDKSNVSYKKGKLYIIEGKTTKNQEITLKVINYEDKAVLDEIVKKPVEK